MWAARSLRASDTVAGGSWGGHHSTPRLHLASKCGRLSPWEQQWPCPRGAGCFPTLGVRWCSFNWCWGLCVQEHTAAAKLNSRETTHLVTSTLGVHKHKQGFHERRRDGFYHKRTTFVFLLKEESGTAETYIRDSTGSPTAGGVTDHQHHPHPCKNKKQKTCILFLRAYP